MILSARDRLRETLNHRPTELFVPRSRRRERCKSVERNFIPARDSRWKEKGEELAIGRSDTREGRKRKEKERRKGGGERKIKNGRSRKGEKEFSLEETVEVPLVAYRRNTVF